MKTTKGVMYFLVVTTISFIITNCTQDNNSVSAEEITQTIINLEKGALDRWGAGDPWGYSEIYADEITYFSPGTERRLNGIDTMNALFKPIVGEVTVDHYDLINPKVQIYENVAVLTFNSISYLPTAKRTLRESHWNCTEVYIKINEKWKIIHSHWSRPPTNPKTDTEEKI